MNVVYIVEKETGLRRDGLRVHIQQTATTYRWSVTVPTVRNSSTSAMCIVTGTAYSPGRAKAAAKKAIAVYDAIQGRSLYDRANRAWKRLAKAENGK